VADISPDGSWIVYQSLNGMGNLWRIPASGGDPVQFTEVRSSWPRYSPDGTMIATNQTVDGKRRLAILNSEAGQQLSVFNVPETANFNNGLRWTPSGNAVTYRDWNNGIWQQDLTGGEPRRLPGLPEEKLYSYGWSRDGKQFAFTRGTEIRDLVLIQAVR
jgi:Tol biopolymer transport system component